MDSYNIHKRSMDCALHTQILRGMTAERRVSVWGSVERLMREAYAKGQDEQIRKKNTEMR